MLGKVFAAAFACALVAACAGIQNAGPDSDAPDLAAQVGTADLSAKPPRHGSSRTEYASGDRSRPKAEEYRGEDQPVGARPDFQGVSKGNNGYELNFNDAGIADLAKVVLSDTLGISYAFDPRVQGRVTLSTGGPVTRDELLSILETVLAMNRGALIAEGKVYRIVPDTGGQHLSGVKIDYVTESKRMGPGYGIVMMPLKFAGADTMTRMLGSLAATQNTVQASVYNNLLIIRGSSRERQSLLEIATMFDVDWMKGQSAGIYTLKSASPSEVVGELRQVFQSDGLGNGLINFQPVNRLNAVLVLTQKSALLEKAGQWVERLDRTSSEGDNYFVYRVENGKAKDLAKILNATFGNGALGTIRGAEESEVAPNRAAVKLTSSGRQKGSVAADGEKRSEPWAEQTPLSSQQSDATSSLPQTASLPGDSAASVEVVRIVPDDINNKLLIRAPARVYRKILDVLYRLDRPPLQVLINATLAEVTLNDNLQYGVQFYIQNSKSTAGFTNGGFPAIQPTVPGLNLILGSTLGTPKVVLDALATQTEVRVVSSPSVVVVHNQAATLQVGDEVPIATRQASSTVNPDAPLVNEIQFRDTGVILKVTPRINTSGLVTMDVQQEISSVQSSKATGSSGTLTPTISQRRIASMIAVQDGQMVVLGGLISEQVEGDKSRIPVLDRIPFVGDAVGDTTKSKVRKELIVFLQPKIIANTVEASQVADEVRSQLQLLAPAGANRRTEQRTLK
jgi:general secretion pathway protein D